jgi:hypothetical protein
MLALKGLFSKPGFCNKMSRIFELQPGISFVSAWTQHMKGYYTDHNVGNYMSHIGGYYTGHNMGYCMIYVGSNYNGHNIGTV